MRRLLVVLVLAGCLDDADDPRPGPPADPPDGGMFNPDLIRPGGGGGYGSGAGSGAGSGSPTDARVPEGADGGVGDGGEADSGDGGDGGVGDGGDAQAGADLGG